MKLATGATAGATLMPMVMKAQTKAATIDANWLPEERVIFTFLYIWPIVSLGIRRTIPAMHRL